jgi:hypothetical protein
MAVISETSGQLPVLAFGILGAVFVGDATVTFVRRHRRGANVAQAHRDHAYQRLSRLVGDHRRVTLAGIALTILMAILATGGVLRAGLLLPALIRGYAIVGVALFAVERRAPM